MCFSVTCFERFMAIPKISRPRKSSMEAVPVSLRAICARPSPGLQPAKRLSRQGYYGLLMSAMMQAPFKTGDATWQAEL
jgi:hypothetical protein